MTIRIQISLTIYFTLVSIIGTLGNGVILLAYGNRWNSSRSTSVIFILILACVDLWTCLIVVPTIAIMEYRDFDVPTPICRFYSFSKNLIIISSFIMSFIALDRFLTIAIPHHRLLNPRRVKALLTLFISIGIGLGTITALAFSTQSNKEYYSINYDCILANGTYIINNYKEASLEADRNSSLSSDIIESISEQLPDGANLTNYTFEYKSTSLRCFADTSIISESLRDLLKNLSNKVFFTLIGIVTIFYSITFVLALQRQNPRIRALKKSLNILNKFDSYSTTKLNQRGTDSIVSIQSPLSSSGTPTTTTRTTTTTTTSLSPKQTSIILSELNYSNDNLLSKQTSIKSCNIIDDKQYEMSNIMNNDDSDDANNSSPLMLRKTIKYKKKTQQDHHTSISDGTSDDLQPSIEKLHSTKQVSFQIDNHRNTLTNELNQRSSISSNIFNSDLDVNNDMYYKLPCPCSTTRQFLIKFHFARPSSQLNQWLCCCCCRKNQSSLKHHLSIESQNQDETTKVLTPPIQNTRTTPSQSETLRKQLHRHRLRQIRMASTFLIITVSFVLFYLPSILNAERIIKSPIMIYYLYLCTHALNPIIYCFMNPNLRAYVSSMFNCRTRQKEQNIGKGGRTSIFDR
ncbi:unnamed protein product [Rotaria sordida]|uniref:G-protein coupled receptors family 1 profile domain-containing protein n=1 Tax=Rotaria sordida TaxID=392033 RepID=A0A814ULJ8_9BILA|nr:unnamed protein product [Rotaria sordida]